MVGGDQGSCRRQWRTSGRTGVLSGDVRNIIRDIIKSQERTSHAGLKPGQTPFLVTPHGSIDTWPKAIALASCHHEFMMYATRGM